MKRIFFILLLVNGICKAQTSSSWQTSTKAELINSYKKACDWFINTQDYSFAMKYVSFKDHYSNETLESSEGFYKRSGNKFRMEAVGIKTIQDNKTKIVIDTADRIIALTDPGSLSPNMQTADELIALLGNVKLIRKKNNGKATTYRIDFKKNELYDAYEFTVNEKGILEKLCYFYAEQTEKEYGDGDEVKPYENTVKPRMEITFTNYVFPAKTLATEFSDRSIVIASNKVSLSDKYKGYNIKDYRTSK
jgi:hypothetical protein